VSGFLLKLIWVGSVCDAVAIQVYQRSRQWRSMRQIRSRAFFHVCDVKLDRCGALPRVLTKTSLDIVVRPL
jgi:hypothetical protein